MEIADYERDMIALNRQILALQERTRQLEQLVKLQYQLLTTIPFEPIPFEEEAAWYQDMEKAEAQYNALLKEQEV